MDKEIKQKWVDALRSGKYKQFKGYLWNVKQKYYNATEVCCLGVFDIEVCGYCDSSSQRDKYIPRGIQETLANINDAPESTFTQIADYIEKNL